MIGQLLGHNGINNVQRYMYLADKMAIHAAKLVSGLLWRSLVATEQVLA